MVYLSHLLSHSGPFTGDLDGIEVHRVTWDSFRQPGENENRIEHNANAKCTMRIRMMTDRYGAGVGLGLGLGVGVAKAGISPALNRGSSSSRIARW